MDLTNATNRIAVQGELVTKIKEEVAKVIVGQEKLIDRLVLALVTDGHILLEGVPGLAKTLSVNTLVQPFPLWEYMLVIDEVTGRDFRLDRVDDFFFYTDVGYNHTWTNGKTLWTAESGNAWKSEGCRAVSDAKGIGFLVYGYDAWGRKMSFRAYLDFTEAE